MYCDTSVLVKLLIREPDSEHYARLVAGRPLSTSELALAEVFSALLAKERVGGIRPALRRRAWASFQRRVEDTGLVLVELGSAVIARAQGLLELCHPTVALRSLDALHLATAERRQDWPLVADDRRMREAATRLGYPLTPLP